MAGSLETRSHPLFEGENLSEHFDDLAALTNISFSVREKEVVGVIGPNGAGKTTLLNVSRVFFRQIRYGGVAETSPVARAAEESLILLSRWNLAGRRIGVWSKADSGVDFDEYRIVKNGPEKSCENRQSDGGRRPPDFG